MFCCNEICESRPSGEPPPAGGRVTVRVRGTGDRMARQHRVVDHIVDCLAAMGVEHLFGVDGANIEDLYDAAHFRDDITAVLAKHEFSAATMADGYSRATARLGVVMATSGGGSLNLVAGTWGVAGKRGSRSGAGRSTADVDGRPRKLSGHQRPQWCAGRVGVVLRGVAVVRTGDQPRRHHRCAGCGNRRRSSRGTLSYSAAQGYSTEFGRHRRHRPDVGSAPRHRAIRSRSCGRCAVPAVRSRSSPASRWPATMPAPNSSSCARCCGARVATVPDAKDVSARLPTSG